ncbi:hypothetical protein WB401_45520 [Streptomyces brasiliscabiei]|uniref:Uncharacterized protein n=1 Tax=Streptomyces brasiliscabiei TaxID=2736302 RepID=A0ABU8GTM7_9ACTN
MSEQSRTTEEAVPETYGAVPETNDAPAPALASASDVAEPSEPSVPAPPQVPPRRDRRVLRAVLRWTAAVAVFASVGTATAYGIAGTERTDVPGLATESDGRWVFPRLVRPPLPSGSPEPFAEDNPAGAHHADLRALLLPAPEGAKEDRALRGSDGWLPVKEYLAEFEPEDRGELRQKLVDTGLRHIAARGWTTPDGTRTRVYLLRFGTANVVETELAVHALAHVSPTYRVRGAGEVVYDEDFPEAAAVPEISRTAYTEAKPYGAEQVRQAYLSAGDVYAVILQSRESGARAVPFWQTVVLQSQLLG